MEKEFSSLFETFMRANNKIYEIQKQSVEFEDGSILNTNSIHLIEAIGRHTGSNISELADLLGVTRSAISQQIPKLIEDGFIIRYQKDSNRKEHLMKLTDKGENIFIEHDNIHKEMNEKIMKEIDYNSDEIKKFKEVLNIIEFYIEEYKDKFR